MALWKHEEAILDMLDAGMSHNQVAQRGYTPAQIDCVINAIGTAERHAKGDKRRTESIQRGSQQLLRALQRERTV